MEFSILFEGQLAYPTREHEQEVLRSATDMAMLADELGFDRFYAVEHHTLEGYSHSSAPEVLLGAVAAVTKQIRVAHGVCCLPFKMNHPVRVMERTAMLDIISNGRVDLGVGRSSSRREQETFGVDPDMTPVEMVESLKAMVTFWSADDDEEVEYRSEHLHIPMRKVLPRPVQDPHPPLSMACLRDDSFQLAGRSGLGVISNGIDGPSQVKRKIDLYRKGIAARTPESQIAVKPNDHFGSTVFTIVLDDAEEARRLGLRGMRYFIESARHFFGNGKRPDPDSWTHDETIDALMELTQPKEGATEAVGLVQTLTSQPMQSKSWSLDWADRGTTAYGDAGDTIQFVENLRDAGVDECFFVLNVGSVPLDATMESIRQIGTKVIPHFRKASPKVFDLTGV
jgi:alkanesulfonate monooxygenase SsuD/methylene tetrahydromethanopterin reductase-like flavin-dependent oxidoreductase (luciferase family)